MRIVQRGRGAPPVIHLPCHGEDVVIVPEVIGGLLPQRAVGHLVARHDVLTVTVYRKALVQTIVPAEAQAVHVLVGLHAVVAVQTVVVVTCGDAAPRLSGRLEAAYVLVTQPEVLPVVD